MAANATSATDITMIRMVNFQPYCESAIGGENDFCDRLQLIIQDLHKLLRLPSQTFWEMVKTDETIIRSIDSFLKFSPRHWFEMEAIPSERCRKLLSAASRLVFLFLLRLATNKSTDIGSSKSSSSDTLLCSPAEFAATVYDRRLWDIPRFLDVVAVYGDANPQQLVGKILSSLFSMQPKFFDDLKLLCRAIESSLSKAKQSADHLLSAPASTTPEQLINSGIEDLIRYAYDTFSTVLNFVQLFPEAASYLVDLLPTMADYGETTLGPLGQKCKSAKETSATLCRMAFQAELKLAKAFYVISKHAYLGSGDKFSPDYFISSWTIAAGHRRLVYLLNELYPFEESVTNVEDLGGCVDSTSCEYIRRGIDQAREQFEGQSAGGKAAPTQQKKPPSKKTEPVNPLVPPILELFPELESEFVSHALVYYQDNADALVQALLDDNLPFELKHAKDITPPQHVFDSVNHGKKGQKTVLFETPDFNEPAAAIVHVGKKEVELDQDEVTSMKKFYKKFSSQYNEEDPGQDALFAQSKISGIVPPKLSAVYDDEYDDTYDDNVEPAVEPAFPDEVQKRRPFITPRVLAQKRNSEEEESEETDEEESDDVRQKWGNSSGEVSRGGARGRGGGAQNASGWERQGDQEGQQQQQHQQHQQGGHRGSHDRGYRNKGRHGDHNQKAGALRKRGGYY